LTFVIILTGFMPRKPRLLGGKLHNGHQNLTVNEEIFRKTDTGGELTVSVVPRSSRCEIAGIHNNALRIKLTSPPVDNEANIQCCEFIAKKLGIARRQVVIIRGQTSRRKVLRIEGVSEKTVRETLLRDSPQSTQRPQR
jgi:hypothetical protein